MNNLKKLTIVLGFLGSVPLCHALTPWTDGAPDLVVYTSGGPALDAAFAKIVTNTLAAANTVDTFSDVASTGTIGGRWQAFYFTGSSNLGTTLAGKKIILEKRTYGSGGYGVVPLYANNGQGLPLEHLNIVGLGEAAWEADGTTGKKWKKSLTGSNAATYLTKIISDAGFLALDPVALLKPATENYPEQVKELISGDFEPNWPLDISKTPDNFTVIGTGGYVYGVEVTEDFYRVLQAAQQKSGILPSTVSIGTYTDAAMPSLSRNFLASLLAGKISHWEQIKVVDKATGTAIPLTDPSILALAGVKAPPLNKDGITPVGVGRRNKGATTAVVAYARLLGYPFTARSNPPAANTPNSDDSFAAPIVKSPTSLGATDLLLIDWQTGTNVSGLNPSLTKLWGVAITGGDRDPGATAAGVGGKPWRYIKVDGAAPTIENVAAGVYPLWAEGTVLYPTEKSSDPQWGLKKALLKVFAEDMGSPTLAKTVNSSLTFGVSGIFATTKDPRGFKASVPFDPNNPVVALTHNCVGTSTTSALIVPVADDTAIGGLQLQLK